jgi:hypothetical protein
MNYEEFKSLKAIQDERTDIASDLMNSFAKYKLPNGLTPDHIKQTEQWKEAKKQWNTQFSRTRELNKLGNKLFKKEIREDHRLKREALIRKNQQS